MKIFKYILFISILSSLFIVVYAQSDKKGFGRLWISLKMAALIAAILAGLIPASTEGIETYGNNDQVYQERLLSDQEFNSFEDNQQKVILVKIGDSAPSVPISPGRGQPSQFPTPSRPVYVPKHRIAPKIIDPGLGAGANPAGAGGGGENPEFDDQCPVPKNKQSQESKTSNYDYHSNTQQNKDKKKKRRNSHLDRKVEIKGHNFEIERAQVERKTPRHGVDLDLNPDTGVDGKPILDKKTQKPMAKGNKENYELFEDNLEKYMENSEMREGYFRKGRENQQEVFNFYDTETNRVASFRKDNGKFISFWKMDKPGQIDEFLNNNDVI
jgi:hypothetical protein